MASCEHAALPSTGVPGSTSTCGWQEDPTITSAKQQSFAPSGMKRTTPDMDAGSVRRLGLGCCTRDPRNNPEPQLHLALGFDSAKSRNCGFNAISSSAFRRIKSCVRLAEQFTETKFCLSDSESRNSEARRCQYIAAAKI